MKRQEISPSQPAFDGLPGIEPFTPAGRADDGMSRRVEPDITGREQYVLGRQPSATSETRYFPIPTNPDRRVRPGPEVQLRDSDLIADGWNDAFITPRTDADIAAHQNGITAARRLVDAMTANRLEATSADDRNTKARLQAAIQHGTIKTTIE